MARRASLNLFLPFVFKKTHLLEIAEDLSREHPFNGSLVLHLKPYARIRPENNPVSLGARIPLVMRGRAPWRLVYKISNWM
jgi:hypothetical protein